MDTRTYRAAPGAYLVFATISGLLSALWLAAVWRTGAPLLPLVVPLGGFALAALWLSRFRVRLGEEELLVSAPFHGARRIARKEILSVEFATETGRTESPFVLCIRTSAGEELRFNAKVFSTAAVQNLLALTPRARAPQSKRPR